MDQERSNEGAGLFVRLNGEGSGLGLMGVSLNVDVNEERAAKDGEIFPFLLSEAKEDRYLDVVDGPWALGAYRANPVVLWSHNSSLAPVGRAEGVKWSQAVRQLTGRVRADDHPVNPMGQLVAHQLRSGFLRAGSVGFRPKKVQLRSGLADDDSRKGDRGYLLTHNELLEFSITPIPALRSALHQVDTDKSVRTLDDLWARAQGVVERTVDEERDEVADALKAIDAGALVDALLARMAEDADARDRLRRQLGLAVVESPNTGASVFVQGG